MSVANKLSYLGETKEKIREGINKLGGGLSTSNTFRSYADKLDEIYDSMPKVEESDVESATLEGTIKGGLDINPKGNTSQYSTIGKNLLHLTIGDSITSRGVTFTKNSDGTISLSGTATANVYQTIGEASVVNGTDYYLSGCPSGGGDNTYKLYTSNLGGAYDSGYGVLYRPNATGIATMTIAIYSGTNVNGVVFKPMLELGTSRTSFEPYTNGASPNPDYPQQIHEVSGDNEVVVCGKNLFNKNDVFYNKTTNSSGEAVDDSRYVTSNFIKVKPNTEYYIDNNLPVVLGYDINKNFVISIRNTQSGGSFTTPNNCEYVRVRNWQLLSTLEEKQNAVNQCQLELGTTSSQYEPYNGDAYELDLGVENLFNSTLVNGVVTNNAIADSTTRIASNQFIKLKENTQYTISYETTNGINSVNVSLFSSNDFPRASQTDWQSSIVKDNRLYINFSTTSNSYVLLTFRKSDDGTIIPSDITNIQIEEGSKANSYSPFGQTPIEMNGIGDYQDYFTKNSGKNLIQLTNQDFSIGDLHYSVDGGVLQATGSRNPEVQRTNSSFKNNFKMTLQAGTYKLNFSESGTKAGTLNYYIMKYSDDSEIKRIQTTYDTFTLTEETEVYLGIYSYQLAITGTLDIRIMLCKDDGTTPVFEPYGTGQWCKYNAIGKVVLDGSETWYLWNIGNTNTQRFYTRLETAQTDGSPLDNGLAFLNNFAFIQGAGNADIEHYRGSATNNIAELIIFINRSRLNSVDVTGMKTWATNNNITAYFPLKTPYLSLIEDETLINQLDNIENAMSYEGTTNIGQVNNDKAFKIDIKAILDWRNSNSN